MTGYHLSKEEDTIRGRRSWSADKLIEINALFFSTTSAVFFNELTIFFLSRHISISSSISQISAKQT